MLKFGLDWSWMDINYAKSAIEMFDESSSEDFSSDVHQAEIGMQFGPSVTVNPVHHLKIGGYFRVTPSYSLLYMDETVHHHYVTFCNAGCTLAWKVVSLGVEWRWGTAKYDGLKFDESAFDEDDPDGRRLPLDGRRDGPDEGSRPQVQDQFRPFLSGFPVLRPGPADRRCGGIPAGCAAVFSSA